MDLLEWMALHYLVLVGVCLISMPDLLPMMKVILCHLTRSYCYEHCRNNQTLHYQLLHPVDSHRSPNRQYQEVHRICLLHLQGYTVAQNGEHHTDRMDFVVIHPASMRQKIVTTAKTVVHCTSCLYQAEVEGLRWCPSALCASSVGNRMYQHQKRNVECCISLH